MLFRTPRARGFTLVEIAVVLFIVGVLIAMAAAVTRGVSAAQKRSLTATKMAVVDAALVQFVQQRKRLPCPADGTLASTNINAGLENNWAAAGCTGNQAGGVVPWRALGLSEQEVTDGWDRRMTFRIQATLAATNALDMSGCDPAGSAAGVGAAPSTTCAPGCTTTTLTTNCTPPGTYLSGRGLQVRNIAGTVLMDPGAIPHTGAAYVLVSPGETGGGGYLSSGTLGVTTGTDGTEEQKNYASLALQAYYVDDSINDNPGNAHFDDIVSRPALLQVVTKAGLGPRTH